MTAPAKSFVNPGAAPPSGEGSPGRELLTHKHKAVHCCWQGAGCAARIIYLHRNPSPIHMTGATMPQRCFGKFERAGRLKAIGSQQFRRGPLLAATALCLLSVLPVANGQEALGKTQPGGTERSLRSIPRRVPVPLPGHPGNVFLLGEQVSFLVPSDLSGAATRWEAIDDRGAIVGSGVLAGAKVAAGKLDIGWYRIWLIDAEGRKWERLPLRSSPGSPGPCLRIHQSVRTPPPHGSREGIADRMWSGRRSSRIWRRLPG